MECRGSCRPEASSQVDECWDSTRQKFLTVARTIQPASDPSLCLTATGYAGRLRTVRLHWCCRGAVDQDWREVQLGGGSSCAPCCTPGGAWASTTFRSPVRWCSPRIAGRCGDPAPHTGGRIEIWACVGRTHGPKQTVYFAHTHVSLCNGKHI